MNTDSGHRDGRSAGLLRVIALFKFFQVLVAITSGPAALLAICLYTIGNLPSE